MKKKCERCGELFEAKKDFHKLCFKCHSGTTKKTDTFPAKLFLNTYYDSEGNFLKEVFIGIPEEIARFFAKSDLTTKQLRDFHSLISEARNEAILKGIASARHLLWECQTKCAYQFKRQQVPESFVNFISHHLALAEKDEKNLEGFYQHFDSIVCYFPKEQGGLK